MQQMAQQTYLFNGAGGAIYCIKKQNLYDFYVINTFHAYFLGNWRFRSHKHQFPGSGAQAGRFVYVGIRAK